MTTSTQPLITTERLIVLVQNADNLSPMFPAMRTRFYTAISNADPMPINVIASAIICVPRGVPVLQFIQVFEEQKRQGYGFELLEAVIANEGGKVSGIFCTPESEALARKYEREYGPQPWRIGGMTDDELLASAGRIAALVGSGGAA